MKETPRLDFWGKEITWKTICPGSTAPHEMGTVLAAVRDGAELADVVRQAQDLLAKGNGYKVPSPVERIDGFQGCNIPTGAKTKDLTVVRGNVGPGGRGSHLTLRFRYQGKDVVVSSDVTVDEVLNAYRIRMDEDANGWKRICPGGPVPRSGLRASVDLGTDIARAAGEAIALLKEAQSCAKTAASLKEDVRRLGGPGQVAQQVEAKRMLEKMTARSTIAKGTQTANLVITRGGKGFDTTLSFEFSGITVIVRHDDIADDVASAYLKRWDEDARLYRESPEGQAEKARCEQERIERQEKHDACMAGLEDAAGDQTRLIAWLIEYSGVADDTTIKTDYPSVLTALEAAGYRENAHVTRPGQPKADFTDPSVMAEYVVGQAISALRKGMGPHPNMTHKFGTDYLEMVAAAPVP